MRVVHVNAKLAWSGGIEIYMLSLLPELESRGHECHALYAEGDAGLWPRSHRVPVIDDVKWNASRRGYREATDLFDAIQPDVIHLHNIHNLGTLRACLESAPTVLTAHDYRYVCPASTFYYRRGEDVCRRRCGPRCFTTTLARHCMSLRPNRAWHQYHRVRWFARRLGDVAHVIAPSKAARQRFLDAGVPADRATTLPYFCPLEPLSEPRPLPPQPKILFIGRVRPNKGYRYFIQALGMLPSHISGLLVGDVTPAREQELRQLAVQAGCADRLELRPWADREDVAEVYREASVFVFPSVWDETLGIVGLEALACGVPAVASDVGGVREWLHNGRTGRLVPARDPGALATAVQQIVNSSGRAQQMGLNGIRLVKERFSREGHIARLLEIYSNASSSKAA